MAQLQRHLFCKTEGNLAEIKDVQVNNVNERVFTLSVVYFPVLLSKNPRAYRRTERPS